MGARVIHTGQALVDEVLAVPSLPPRGGNVFSTSSARYAASAVNVLLAAARSGAACIHAGSVGSGPNGDLVRGALAEEGVQISSPAVPDLDTGTCLVLLEPSAERTFITMQGAERRISVESLQTSDPQPGDVVCLSGYTLVGETAEPLLAWAEALPDGVIFVLDPGAPFAQLAPEVRSRALALCSVWTSNAEEASAVAGAAMPIAESAKIVASLLPGGAAAVVRDGPAGCVLHTGGHLSAYPGYPQTPVDTNGAGDAHTGVLVAQLVRGTSWDDALPRANAAGAIKVTRRGPGTAPTTAEIDAFLRSSLTPAGRR